MNEIFWPDFSDQPPKALGIKRRDVWQRMQAGMYLMATTGWSVVQELIAGLAERYDTKPNADSLHRIFRVHLYKTELIHYQVLPHLTKNGLAVVRLTKLGKAICSKWDWRVVVSDWEKLIEYHDGDQQIYHTAMVLDFAWQARRRGYSVVVIPIVQDKFFIPDIYLERSGIEKAYVEVERGRYKPEKWRNLYKMQGFAAICLPTAFSRRKIVDWHVKPLGIGGVATDLQTIKTEKIFNVSRKLWVEQW